MKFINRYTCKSGFECENCGDYVIKGAHYYTLTNHADETVKVCPDCAAHCLAETLDGVTWAEYNDNSEE